MKKNGECAGDKTLHQNYFHCVLNDILHFARTVLYLNIQNKELYKFQNNSFNLLRLV